MKPGCFLSLALLSGLTALYHQWFQQIVDPPWVWIASFIAALVIWLCIGALQNAWSIRKSAAAIRRHLDGLAPMDGQLEAAAGRIALHGDPILSPLTGTECAFYEYEIYRMVKQKSSKNGTTSTTKVVDFAGIGVTQAFVQDDNGEIALFGFPDLTSLSYDDVRDGGPSVRGRAKRLVEETAWEDCSGFKALSGFGRMMQALSSSDDSRRHDWRMISPKDCAWLTPGEADPETYVPVLAEKCVPAGYEVVAIGPYSAEVQGLVTKSAKNLERIQIVSGSAEEAEKSLRGSVRSHIFGSLFFLVATQLVAWGMLTAYRNSSEAQRKWAKQFDEALKADDIPAAERLLERGLKLEKVFGPRDAPPLSQAKSAAVARLLLAHGADPNAADEEGSTPLMIQARENRVDILKLLIEAGADLNAKSRAYGTTALVRAVDGHSREAAEYLRSAGAIDDEVRAATGTRIDAAHPAVQAARNYVLLIHKADVAGLKRASSSDRPAKFEDVDWPLWHNSRPVDPELVAAFVRGSDATVTLTGPGGAGYSTTWSFQMLLENGEWKVVRERWLDLGYEE